MRFNSHTAPALKPRHQSTRQPAFAQGWRPERQLSNGDALIAFACGVLLAACCFIPFLSSSHH